MQPGAQGVGGTPLYGLCRYLLLDWVLIWFGTEYDKKALFDMEQGTAK